MKKVLLVLLLLFVTLISVNAKENRLYFKEIERKIYYDSGLLDKNVFMHHVDMLPGSRYTDELIIENASNTKYTLYFKVEVRDQSKNALELLDYTSMKLYLDNVLLYDGNLKGLDYNKNGVNLQNVIKIGDIDAKSTRRLRAETKLSEDYSNNDNSEYSYVDWDFYAEFEDSMEIIVPKTDMNENILFKLLAVLVFIIAIILIVFTYEKSKKKPKKNGL